MTLSSIARRALAWMRVWLHDAGEQYRQWRWPAGILSTGRERFPAQSALRGCPSCAALIPYKAATCLYCHQILPPRKRAGR